MKRRLSESRQPVDPIAIDRRRNPFPRDDKPGTGEFSDRGRADLKIVANDPRFADNPMDPLAEVADSSKIDRLHQMLTNAGIGDQQIKGGVALTQDGKNKVAARLGIGPQEVEMYLNGITQQLRDADAQSEESLTEFYRRIIDATSEVGDPDRPFDLSEARYSYEPDALGSVTVRDQVTGRSSFLQGAAADRVLTQLKVKHADADTILAPLVEALDDTATDFWDEIEARSGSYNFQWKLADQHGTGTVLFHADRQPALRLVDVRDADGNEVQADHAMRQDLLHQAHGFIGQE